MSFLPEFLHWHYVFILHKLLILWINFTFFPLYWLAVPLHLSTFLKPWKRQSLKTKPGFHISDFLAVYSFNILARMIGMILRFYAIATAVILSIILSLIFLLLLGVWLLLPWLSFIYYQYKAAKKTYSPKQIFEFSNDDIGLLLKLLFRDAQAKFIFTRLGFNTEELQKNLSAGLKKFEYNKFSIYLKKKRSDINIIDIIDGLTLSFPMFKEILDSRGIKTEDLHQTSVWYQLRDLKQSTPLLYNLERIKKLPGFSFDWAFGFTVELDKFSTEYTATPINFPYLYGRDKEINELAAVMLKNQANNVLIVGEPGVARHALVEALSQRIKSGESEEGLRYKRLILLNMPSLVSAKPSILEAKGLASEILKEAQEAGNVILVIDDIDKFISSGDARIDLSDIFTKFAKSPIGVIGLTTPQAYHKYIKVNPNLMPLFAKIDLGEPDIPTVYKELELSIVPVLEKKYQVLVTYPTLKKVVEDCDKYISSSPYPARAIELLDEAIVLLKQKKKAVIVNPVDVENLIEAKFHINIGDLQRGEREKLLKLEDLLHKQVINQEEAISTIASALRRARLGVSSPKRPIGSFLFLGPTGVGKTETAKALAKTYFGKDENMLRFDMSQYQKEEGMERLIGSIKLSSPGELTAKLLDNPFSLLLLDEFEKSDTEVLNLFLTLFDEGYISDANGKRINARNTIVIATSNAGGEFIREGLKSGTKPTDLTKQVIEYVQKEKIFSPELLNRFDGVVVFSPLSKVHLAEVAKLMLADLNSRLKPKEISVEVTPVLINKLVEFGFNRELGARAMRRAIAEKIEDQVAQKILSGEAKKGDRLKMEI